MILNRKFGEYILLQRLAIGGQSEVFLALKAGPRDFTRPVVIKALPSSSRDDERLVEMFYREAFISSRFSHPNVINVHDARVIEDDHCMLMDFVNGQTVADIAQRGYQQQCPPTLKQVVQIVADAADGLAYVHDFKALDHTSYSVVHLDVSPQNIMVTYQGVGMIFDFGIARIIGLDDEQPRLAGGKYAYMSPEQLRGGTVDPRSDLFSLGIILYELCTGYRLFRRKTPQEVIRAITEEPIQPPRELRPEIPQFLEDVILRALDRDPFERYQSAGRMRDDLLKFLNMTSEGADLRRGLGVYVSGMFKKERNEIAQALQAAPQPSDARPLDEPLTELGTKTGATRDPTMELLVPNEVADAASKVLEDQDVDAAQTAERNIALQEELERMRRRQNVLYAVLVVIALLALFLGFVQIVDGKPAPAEEPPTQLE
jgi:serine/threonine-protein kinase